MSKKIKVFFDKATKFYKEHEETIKNIVEKTGIVEKLGFGKPGRQEECADSDTLKTQSAQVKTPVKIQDIEETVEVEEAEIITPEPPRRPTSLKEYREEVEIDRSFEDGLDTLGQCTRHTLANINDPNEVMNAFSTLANVAQETIRYAEEQESRREEIRAMRDTSIAQINAIKESLQLYLEKSFDERKELFAKQFECVDAALASGNTEMLAMALASINSLAASSPFKNLSDCASVQKSLLNPNTEWDI